MRHPKSSCIVSSILSVALTLSPVLAQSPQTPVNPVSTEDNETVPNIEEAALPDPPVPIVERTTESKSGIPIVLPPLPGPAYSSVVRSAMPSRSSGAQSDGKAPGQTKWVILAVLLAAGTGVAIYYLLRGIGGDDSHSVGTVITAGPPAVTTPAR